ncbi:Hydroquinone glucosyltransferase [Dichanthelium oligosanthes]|uniref:Hydroquinone glucosyltransferase n=1 Tax=Dichanthelium oligosanthes TaxID=888268 RepID=A0A1E5V8G7_9POAL|nr:Hydroquinone glucosyltransferase [Dichanthelium oligosanthes]
MRTEAAPTTPAKRAAHVVLLASPGAGHILPVAELARRIVAHGDGAEFTATLVTYTNFSSAEHHSTLASLPPSVSTAVFPEVPLDDLPANAHIETRIFTTVKRSLPRLRDLLRSLLESPSGVAAFVPDLLGPWTLQVAVELGVPGYLFCTTNLMAFSCMLHVPELDRTTTGEFRDLPEPVRLPGCVPLRGADLLDPLQDRSDPVYPLMIEFGKNHLLANGFIVNTFDAMEHKTLVAFKEISDKGVYPPAYAVGPFVRPCAGGESAEHGCLQWLDKQPDASVLYVCLGSGGTLSTEQTAELAAGLEASGQRFLWVVRFPSDKDCSASYFGTAANSDDPVSYLPEGFLERTKGVGICLPLWAPQVEILNHRAVGGFLSHCGWNSTLEATTAGVPKLAWPLYAEQRMNAVMLSERAGLALRPSEGSVRENGVVPQEEVAAVVRELIAGEKGAAARQKALELRDGAVKAWAPDGPSRRAFEAVVGKWKKVERAG